MNRDSLKKYIKIGISVIIVVGVITYIAFSFKDYVRGPHIIISSPENGSTIATSTVTIHGQVLRVQEVTLNGRPLLIDKQGNFVETLLLFPGYNVSLFRAHDKFNRTTEYKLELVYKK